MGGARYRFGEYELDATDGELVCQDSVLSTSSLRRFVSWPTWPDREIASFPTKSPSCHLVLLSG